MELDNFNNFQTAYKQKGWRTQKYRILTKKAHSNVLSIHKRNQESQGQFSATNSVMTAMETMPNTSKKPVRPILGNLPQDYNGGRQLAHVRNFTEIMNSMAAELESVEPSSPILKKPKRNVNLLTG